MTKEENKKYEENQKYIGGYSLGGYGVLIGHQDDGELMENICEFDLTKGDYIKDQDEEVCNSLYNMLLLDNEEKTN